MRKELVKVIAKRTGLRKSPKSVLELRLSAYILQDGGDGLGK